MGRKVTSVLLVLLLALLSGGALHAQQQPPITKAGLLTSLRIGGVGIQEYVNLIRQHGVNFHLSSADAAEIRKAGKFSRRSDLDKLLNTIVQNFRPATRPQYQGKPALVSGLDASNYRSFENRSGNSRSSQATDQLIHSINLSVTFNLQQSASVVARLPNFDNTVALFTDAGRKIHLVADRNIHTEQISSNVSRFTVSYKTESEAELIGHPIAELMSITRLSIDYSKIFAKEVREANPMLSLSLLLNEVEYAPPPLDVDVARLSTGEIQFELRPFFVDVFGQYLKNSQSSMPQPVIDSMSPPNPSTEGAYVLNFTGLNFRPGMMLRVKYPNGAMNEAKVVGVNPTMFLAFINFQGQVGVYSVAAQNTDGSMSQPFSFTVGSSKP
jgi:hypothetical protein